MRTSPHAGKMLPGHFNAGKGGVLLQLRQGALEVVNVLGADLLQQPRRVVHRLCAHPHQQAAYSAHGAVGLCGVLTLSSLPVTDSMLTSASASRSSRASSAPAGRGTGGQTTLYKESAHLVGAPMSMGLAV